MYKSKIGNKGLRELTELENGFDISGGMTETPIDLTSNSVKNAFCTFVKKLRLDRGLDVFKLSQELDVNVQILKKLEHDVSFKPDPRTLAKLSEFYEIPMKVFIELVGAKLNCERKLGDDLVVFAVKSESLETLTKDEKKLLKDFVNILKKKYD